MRAAPLLVGEAGVQQGAHDAERERAVGARQRPQVDVGDARRAAAERIDRDQPRAAPARLEDEAPEVRRRGQRVPAPHAIVRACTHSSGSTSGEAPLVAIVPADARARADRAHERRAADRVEQPVAHHVALHEALRAEVAVGDDRRAAVPLDRALQAARGDVERLVPAHLAEAALALGAGAHERAQQALVGVHALEVVRHLAAQEPRRDRVIGVALDARRAAGGVDLDEQGAGVGTVVRAGPADDLESDVHGDHDPTTTPENTAGISPFPLRIA